MSKIDGLTEILNWKLLDGSHEWPGPSGGTCINEAAIVAAGFKYREVSSYTSLPQCFCPVIGSFLIVLNDSMNNDERQLLIKYVLKLAGSRTDKRGQYKRLKAVLKFANVGRCRPFGKARISDIDEVMYSEVLWTGLTWSPSYDNKLKIDKKVLIEFIDSLFEIGPNLYEDQKITVDVAKCNMEKIKAEKVPA